MSNILTTSQIVERAKKVLATNAWVFVSDIPEITEEFKSFCETIINQNSEIEQQNKWISDLQSGMYVNCVYCGHRYGPKDNTPTSMADILKEHIEECPKHPMSLLKTELDEAKAKAKAKIKNLEEYNSGISQGSKGSNNGSSSNKRS